ncbi:MAG: RIP metalloprotease RseP [Clostridia bacterium]|nr:RIP metalloprotease RseP [Clostridia bacterium]
MQTAIVSIIVFSVLILVHEFGHYAVAKLAGVRVEEFSLGMGTKIVGKKYGETLYSIRALPLGGYCKMTGENVEGNEEQNDPKRFDKKPLWARVAIVITGPLMNFFLAVVIFIIIFTTLGVPNDFQNIIGKVMDGKPAQLVGIQEDDRIVSVNNKPVEGWNELVDLIRNSSGNELHLEIERGNEILIKDVVPQYDKNNKVALLGISPKELKYEQVGFFTGVIEGFTYTFKLTVNMVEQVGLLIARKIPSEGVTGPVGIIKIIGEQASFGIINLANLTAIISINLGLINLFPIPALDGGRLFFFVIEGIRGKKVNPEKEGMVHFIGFVLLMALMIFITWKDILRII